MTFTDVKSQWGTSDSFRRRVRWAWGVASRGKWLVLGCVLLVMVPTITYLYRAERLYTAQVDVLIEAPEIGDNLLERSFGKSRLTEASIQTEADILASAALMERVVRKLRLNEDPEFNASLRPVSPWATAVAAINPLPYLTGVKAGEQQLTPEGRQRVEITRIQGAVSSRLSVKSRRRSFVISAQFTANNGEKAARVANTLAETYVLDRLDSSLQEARRANDWLAERLEELRHDVVAAEQAAERYRALHNLGTRRKGERQLTVTDQQLTELNSRLVLYRSDLSQKQARQDQLRGLQRNQRSLETAYDVLQSPLIQRLREQESTKERELSEAMKTYGDRHPRIIGVRADLDELRTKIKLEIDKIAASLTTEAEAARVAVVSLERQIAQLQQGANEAGGLEVELRELERQAETSRTLYEAFLSRYKRDAEQERIQRANARVLSAAPIPVQPSSPRRIRIFLAALALSGLGGIGLVFLLDRLNARIRSAEEMEDLTGLQLLATIPHVKKKNKQDRQALAFEVIEAPRSHLANAFRSLRAVLNSRTRGGGKLVLVTSSVPAEGKSFVTRSLALTLAAGGNRVLVIDADLHRPSQHLYLGLNPEIGVTQILIPDGSGAPPAASPVIRDQKGGFDLLPAGKVDVGAGHALSGDRFAALIREMTPRYDTILVDAPPSLATTDVQMLTQVADQVVFVVKWNETSRDAIRGALQYLTKVGAPLAGFVLAQTREGAELHSYGSYGYYAGYGDNDRKA